MFFRKLNPPKPVNEKVLKKNSTNFSDLPTIYHEKRIAYTLYDKIDKKSVIDSGLPGFFWLYSTALLSTKN